MKTIVLLCVLFGISLALSRDLDIPQKRLYATSSITLPELPFMRIIGGKEVAPHSIPSQVRLITTSLWGSWSCGASLISAKFVLTAAHCVDGGVIAELILGAHNLKEDEDSVLRVRSTRLVAHQNYDSNTISNDIGIIQLDSAVQLNEFINVVSLAKKNFISYEGQSARVSGWGLTLGHGSLSSVLQAVNSTVISHNQCGSYFSIYQETQICISGDGSVGSCNGDSGGPLVVGNEQVGIVSYGTNGCLPGYPSAFTRVSSFIDWVVANSDLQI